ncbi:MAG: hypothetical protein NTX00_01915 [Candidatus Parcubacteria bacterium]|nr:hypothetical protein [Candidatus Parcubacteria bacterium]
MINETKRNNNYATLILIIFRNICIFILEFPKYSILIFLISLFIFAFFSFLISILQILLIITGLILSQNYSINIINSLIKFFKIEELHINKTYGADQKPWDLIAISKKIIEVYFYSVLVIELLAKSLKKYINFQIPQFTIKKKIIYSVGFFIIAYLPGLFIFPTFALIFLIVSISTLAVYFAYSAFLNFTNKFFNLIQKSNESKN